MRGVDASRCARRATTVLVLFFLAASAPGTARAGGGEEAPDSMDAIAEAYVALVLRVGEHDPGYVDAYYGPESWLEAAKANPGSLDDLASRSLDLLRGLEAIPGENLSAMQRLRRDFLTAQLHAVHARVGMLEGQGMSFDEESKALYDAVAPHHEEASFQETLDALDERLAGDGPLAERYARYRERFVIPPGRLDAVFHTAIEECRRRTLRHLELPDGEDFSVTYVTGKSWSAYNWYQGHARSLIQVNTDLPVSIDRAIDLACHEGYPGHHVYNTLLEARLVRERGWVEFTVYPLFSPQSLVAEGSANYGIEVCFPKGERLAFERDVLFPLAGLDPATAAEHAATRALVDRLSYAGNEAARRYLDGEIDAEEAAAWLERFALMPPDHARKRVRFFDDYRSYVINYNLGRDLVAGWVERRVESPDANDARWRAFGQLLASPRLPSALAR